MRLDYSINMNRPQNDPDFSTNADLLMSMQNAGAASLQQGQQQMQQQPPVEAIQPQDGKQQVLAK